MEEKLIELFKLANDINENQDKVYFKFEYTADNTKKLEIHIISKENYSFIETDSIMLKYEPIEKIDTIIKYMFKYAGGVANE